MIDSWDWLAVIDLRFFHFSPTAREQHHPPWPEGRERLLHRQLVCEGGRLWLQHTEPPRWDTEHVLRLSALRCARALSRRALRRHLCGHLGPRRDAVPSWWRAPCRSGRRRWPSWSDASWRGPTSCPPGCQRRARGWSEGSFNPFHLTAARWEQMMGCEWLLPVDFPRSMEPFKLDPSYLAEGDPPELGEEEMEVKAALETLGITSEHILNNQGKDCRSSITGVYRILLHRAHKRRAVHVVTAPTKAVGPTKPSKKERLKVYRNLRHTSKLCVILWRNALLHSEDSLTQCLVSTKFCCASITLCHIWILPPSVHCTECISWRWWSHGRGLI